MILDCPELNGCCWLFLPAVYTMVRASASGVGARSQAFGLTSRGIAAVGTISILTAAACGLRVRLVCVVGASVRALFDRCQRPCCFARKRACS